MSTKKVSNNIRTEGLMSQELDLYFLVLSCGWLALEAIPRADFAVGSVLHREQQLPGGLPLAASGIADPLS